MSATQDMIERGLTSSEVALARAEGMTNEVEQATSRTILQIVRANVLTLFNAILTACVVVVLLVGHFQDAVFAIVMVTNALIGIVSESRAKRTLDQLTILNAPRSIVIRDGEECEIPAAEIVRGDVIRLLHGDQVPADGDVLDSHMLKIDESMLTGESVPVHKNAGDTVMSGTAVVAGSGTIRATAVGYEAYAQQLTVQARRFTRTRSDIAEGINTILKWISWVIIPVVALLVYSQLHAGTQSSWQHALVLAVAGVVGMIPQGLVLLTSLNFALAAAKLARDNVLVQELNAVEVLARVDRLCLDKTGTLTSGAIAPRTVIDCTVDLDQAHDNADNTLRLRAIAATEALVADAHNDTARATAHAIKQFSCELIKSAATPDNIEPLSVGALIPFDSTRKYSALVEERAGSPTTWFFGAPEIVTAGVSNANEVTRQVRSLAEEGARVVALSMAEGYRADLDNPVIPSGHRAVFLVVLEEEIRPDAHETLAFFTEQGVVAKVISGDNPTTVGAIAARVGLIPEEGNALRVVDARELPTDVDALRPLTARYDVYGRVTPEVKRALVHALQAEGHTVAMTGDGVNDVLALKDADLGIAMGSGAPATKAVAKIVLVDQQFSTLPNVVAHGRRIMANMERVSSLFLTKTFLSAILAISVSVMAWKYPFLPRHLTLIGSLTIGIPSFFLALAPNRRRYRPGFLARTLALAIPTGTTLAAVALIGANIVANQAMASTVATISVTFCGIYLLSILSRPLVAWRAALLASMSALAVLVLLLPAGRTFFALEWPGAGEWRLILVLSAVAAIVMETLYRIQRRRAVDAITTSTHLE